jgi:hypothetical protein
MQPVDRYALKSPVDVGNRRLVGDRGNVAYSHLTHRSNRPLQSSQPANAREVVAYFGNLAPILHHGRIRRRAGATVVPGTRRPQLLRPNRTIACLSGPYSSSRTTGRPVDDRCSRSALMVQSGSGAAADPFHFRSRTVAILRIWQSTCWRTPLPFRRLARTGRSSTPREIQ